MTSGVFLSRVPAAAATANSVGFDIATEQLTAPSSHSTGVHVQQPGDLGVSAVADLHRLEPGIEAPLAFVEQTVEQHNRGFELVGKEPQPGTQVKPRRLGVIDRTGGELAATQRSVRCQVEVAAAHLLAGEATAFDQPEQGLFGLDMENAFEL